MTSKRVRVWMIAFLAITVLVSLAGCAKPPTKEMADAETAFQAAKDAGAQQYAPDQYMTAEQALTNAKQLMEKKNYKQAREKALEAMKLAREAQVNAVEGKNTVNKSAQEMYNLALDAVNKANEAGAYTYAKEQMLDAQRTLEEAKKTYEAGDYKTAKQLAEAALTKAQAAGDVAKKQRASQDTRVVQEVAGEIRDPGSAPRPYPANHIVIKGETLWWIAEYKQIYDDPFQWPLIYKANRKLIKDPDLIFPNQDFAIPRSPEVTEKLIKDAIKFAKSRGKWTLHDGK